MPWVYILECNDSTLYVGITRDLDLRLDSHRARLGCSYTAKRLPVFLVYSEHHHTLAEAVARERQLKRWSAQKKRALVASDHGTLQRLAKRRQSKKR